jgi:hypothetical protein
MMCVQLFSSIGSIDSGSNSIAGAYCVKGGTEYDAAAPCQ